MPWLTFHTSSKVKSQRERWSRAINAVTENQSYLRNGKADYRSCGGSGNGQLAQEHWILSVELADSSHSSFIHRVTSVFGWRLNVGMYRIDSWARLLQVQGLASILLWSSQYSSLKRNSALGKLKIDSEGWETEKESQDPNLHHLQKSIRLHLLHI